MSSRCLARVGARLSDEGGLGLVAGVLLALPLVALFAGLIGKGFVLWQLAQSAATDVEYAALDAAAQASLPLPGAQGGVRIDPDVASRAFLSDLAQQFRVDPVTLAPTAISSPLSGALQVSQFLVYPTTGGRLPAQAPDGRPVTAPALWVKVLVPLKLATVGGRSLEATLPIRGLAYPPVYQTQTGRFTVGR